MNRDDWWAALREEKAKTDKSYQVALFLSFFLGILGADRFYLGYGWLGFLKFMSLGGFFIWWLVDLAILLSGNMKDAEGRALRRMQRD